jgi:TolB-like protein
MYTPANSAVIEPHVELACQVSKTGRGQAASAPGERRLFSTPALGGRCERIAKRMGSASIKQNGPPPQEVRAQVQRMTASDVFVTSPQLAAFLLFVVEAVLRGHGQRLKGYTIGVEVLRRDTSFDPQTDPIVRVEATRLRRAIERYYAGPGADDPVMIELPRGGYAPRISWRAELASTPIVEPVLQPGNGMPTLRVAPFVIVGTADTRAIAAETFGSRIAEVFALFEGTNVMVAAPPSARHAPLAAAPSSTPANRSDYRLDGTIEYRGNGLVDVRFKLVDESDATVIWSRAFERLSDAEGSGETERNIILELATAVVQPYGVISANDRAKRLGTNALDPRYACLLEGGDALRSFDPAAHARVRAELERLTALDPNFAAGFTLLAALYGREHMAGIGGRPGEPPALDRALKAARRGIELRPQSARGYHILFAILFFRGEKDAGILAAEKAIGLNPYDILITAEYGGRLIYCGEIDRGMEMLQRTVGSGAILPSWSHFSLFVGHYMRGDLAAARYHAGQMTTETYVYGQLARAVIAGADGNIEEAHRAKRAIFALQPAWKEDPRGGIAKLINAPQIVDRLHEALTATGYLESDGA